MQRRPCLEEAQIRELVDYGITLEEYFGLPQDIEWAMDRSGRIVILQSRQLNVDLFCVLEERKKATGIDLELLGIRYCSEAE